jgi:hypothetical protein
MDTLQKWKPKTIMGVHTNLGMIAMPVHVKYLFNML